MKRKTEVTESSGNVFKDLGVSAPEEALARAELTARIAELVAGQGLTQSVAAKLLGIDHPKVSALLRGRLAELTGRSPIPPVRSPFGSIDGL